MPNSRAYNMVSVAVRKGDLPHISTQKCVDCGAKAQHYDHRDYSKPLDVEPTCQKCNIKRGKAKPAKDGQIIANFQLPSSLKKRAESRARLADLAEEQIDIEIEALQGDLLDEVIKKDQADDGE